MAGNRFLIAFGGACAALSFIVLTSQPASAAAAGATWTQLTLGTPPNAVVGGFAYDSAHDRGVYFGGFQPDTSSITDEMWTFDGTTWSRPATAATWPTGRQFTSMAYDSDRGRVVLFGGQDWYGNTVNDTWEWNGSSWAQVGFGGPPVRYSAAMTYDPVHHVTLLFGGVGDSSLLNDTWAWDGTNWTQLTPATAPPARELSGLTFDTARGRAVLFGGYGTSGPLGDTWEWDGTNWSQVNSSGPSPRWGFGLAYDALNARSVLFGGDGGGVNGETWEWDGTAWTQDTPATAPPAGTYWQMAYDSARQRVLMYGGDDEGTPTNFFRTTWSVTAATVTVKPGSLSLAPASGVFGGSTTLTATANASGSVAFTLWNGTTVSADTDSSGVASATVGLGHLAAGSYGISATFTPSSAGYSSASATGTLTVTPAPLTVMADDASRLYGAANPAFTASFRGLVAADTPASFTGLTVTAAATATSSVGTYPITPSGLVAPNYSITYLPGTLTVTQAPLTVTANDATRTYGAPDPTFTASFTGLVAGDTPSGFTGLTLTTTATSSSPAGTYAITPAGLVAPNYSVTYVAGTLTVTQAPLTVTANDASRAYGAANPAFTASFSGLVAGDAPADFTGLTLTTTATASSPVGTYAIVASGLVAPNYSITYVSGTLTITAAPLTVTANNASRSYGAPNPAFSATFAGLVGGDTPAQFTGLTLTTTATVSSPVGTYPITAAGLVAPNYSITYVPGTLTVQQEQVSISVASSATVLSGGGGFTVTLSVAGPAGSAPVNEGTIAITDDKGNLICSGVPVVAGTATCTGHASVGTHTFSATYTGTPNIASVTSTFTVSVTPHN